MTRLTVLQIFEDPNPVTNGRFHVICVTTGAIADAEMKQKEKDTKE